MTIRYRKKGAPLVMLTGADSGAGSSRDRAAKGTLLLGATAMLARNFERIHRSKLAGKGVSPLELVGGESVERLGLAGWEICEIRGRARPAPAKSPSDRLSGPATGNPECAPASTSPTKWPTTATATSSPTCYADSRPRHDDDRRRRSRTDPTSDATADPTKLSSATNDR